MTRLTIPALILVLSVTSASALTCMRPDAARLYAHAEKADEPYYIVKGNITLLEAPNLPEPNSEAATFTKARITGLSLTNTGFNGPFEREITLETSCLGPWCGTLDGLDELAIMAIELKEDAFSLRLGPCGGDRVAWDRSGEDRVLACHFTDDCRPAQY